jgi:sugar diacid utilization regulator
VALEEGGLRFHQPHRADRGVEHDVGETIEAVRVIAQSHASSKGARAARARRLDVHANTLAYRLRTIRRLLGGDPARGDLRLTVELALELGDLPRLSG